MVLYAVFLVIVSLLGLSAVAAAGILGRAFGSGPAAGPVAGPPLALSMIVPIKGADAHTEAHLEALVASRLAGEVEYLFAMEAADDPAYAVCERVRERHPERAIRVVLTGPVGASMGKQHNLAGALAEARYEAIGSMDADVLVEPDTLAEALGALNTRGAGVVYFLPCYQGPGPAGGALVALYSNYYFAANIGVLALRRVIPLTIGSLWLTTKTTLGEIGGLERFGATVSDDAAIGRAVARVGRANILLPRVVRIPYEPLDLRGGARHLLKWLTLLRAEGLGSYVLILLTWHPILWAAVALILTAALRFASPWYLVYAVVGLLVAIGLRVGSAYQLDRQVYRQRGLARPLLLIPYELVAVPILFAVAFFRRSIVWRGRRYRIGPHGAIRGSVEVESRGSHDRARKNEVGARAKPGE